ncbi:MAG: hypothetical protein ACXV7F_12315 [Methylomonas sp.]
MYINPYPRRLASQALVAAALCIGGSHMVAAQGVTVTGQAAGTNGIGLEKRHHKVVRGKVAYTLPATKPQRAVKPLRQK